MSVAEAPSSTSLVGSTIEESDAIVSVSSVAVESRMVVGSVEPTTVVVVVVEEVEVVVVAVVASPVVVATSDVGGALSPLSANAVSTVR